MFKNNQNVINERKKEFAKYFNQLVLKIPFAESKYVCEFLKIDNSLRDLLSDMASTVTSKKSMSLATNNSVRFKKMRQSLSPDAFEKYGQNIVEDSDEWDAYGSDETKVVTFLSQMLFSESKRAKLLEQFEDYFFNGRPRFTAKLVRVLLVGNKKAKLLGLVHFLDTLETN